MTTITTHYLNLLKNMHIENNKPFNAKKAVLIEKLEKLERGETLTFADELQLVNCIHVSALTGKLEEFYSLSSSVAENDICRRRAMNKCSICSKCYAKDSVSYRSGLKLCLLINHIVLNCFDISANAWATLAIVSSNGKFRFESHGDVASVQAATNMNRIIETHKWITFGVWTKNYNFWHRAFLKEGKHENMVFIVSSDTVNKVLDVPEFIRPYVDHVFTVFTFAYVKAHNIKIHCGYHHCKDCMLCYTLGNAQFYVNEILKKDTKKYKAYMGIND